MIIQILAHAGETHETSLEAAAHEIPWYLQVIIFVVGITLIYSLLWLITKKIDTSLLVISLILLVTGFLVFQIAPVISILAITAGLLTTLFVTFAGLSTPDKKK